MTKLEEEIAEKEAKGKDTTKLHKKTWLKGKLGLSDSEYEELKLQMTDVVWVKVKNLIQINKKIVEVFNEDGTFSLYNSSY